jgi:hypothetical protein
LRGRGDGTFAARVAWDGSGSGDNPAGGPAVGDLNGDGAPDVVVPLTHNKVLVFINAGRGIEDPPSEVVTEFGLGEATIGDFDADGRADIAFAGSNGVVILPGNGDGTFGAARFFFGGDPDFLFAHDFNGDGATDLGVIGGTVYALINQRGLKSKFIRGDANADETRNVADAVTLLTYLFANGREPACLDAADTNDDGEINMGDPIKLLGHLFASAGPLPEPFEACGGDPTADDELGCIEFRPCG